MTDQPVVTQLPLWPISLWPPEKAENKPNLHTHWQPPMQLPEWVTASPTVMRVLDLLGRLHWTDFPERNLQRNWGQPTIPYAALAAAELLKLNEGLTSMGHLRRFLVEHPGFIWLFGFPLQPAPTQPLGFNVPASLPTQRHLTQMLRHVPNAALQFLLADSVQLILAELVARSTPAIECVSLDTKHIVA